MIIIEFGLSAFEVTIVGELSEIYVCPGEAFGVYEAFIEVFCLI